jgi:hypothetical protein
MSRRVAIVAAPDSLADGVSFEASVLANKLRVVMGWTLDFSKPLAEKTECNAVFVRDDHEYITL